MNLVRKWLCYTVVQDTAESIYGGSELAWPGSPLAIAHVNASNLVNSTGPNPQQMFRANALHWLTQNVVFSTAFFGFTISAHDVGTTCQK